MFSKNIACKFIHKISNFHHPKKIEIGVIIDESAIKYSMSKNQTQQIVFQAGECLTFRLSNGRYGGVIVYQVEEIRDVRKYLLLITDIQTSTKPLLADFMEANCFGRKECTFIDDILIILDKDLQAFDSYFEIVDSICWVNPLLEMGGFRTQKFIQEFELSITGAQKVTYMKRDSFKVKDLIQKK